MLLDANADARELHSCIASSVRLSWLGREQHGSKFPHVRGRDGGREREATAVAMSGQGSLFLRFSQ
jgi:hypothetical protein